MVLTISFDWDKEAERERERESAREREREKERERSSWVAITMMINYTTIPVGDMTKIRTRAIPLSSPDDWLIFRLLLAIKH